MPAKAPADLLRALLAAWRKNRAPELADAIAHVSKIVDRGVPPLGTSGERKAFEAWLKRAQKADPLDLEMLLRDLFDGPGKYIRARLDALDPFEDDPRIAHRVCEYVVESTWYVGDPVGTALFKVLQRHADARTVAAIRASAFLSPNDDTDLGWRQKKLDALAKAVAKHAVVPLDAASLAQIAEAHASAGATSAGEASFAAARDEATRAVAEDQVLEEGGPRGELVALQKAKKVRPLTAAEKKHEAVLLAAHAKRWMGAIAKVMKPKDAVFEDGVLVSGEVDYGVAKVLDAPEWSTVRAVSGSDIEGILALVRRWPNIERVRVIGTRDFLELANAKPPLGLRAVTYSGPERAPSDEERAALTDPPGLPQLEELGISGYWHEPPAIAWILEGALGRRLRRLDYGASLALTSFATTMADAPGLERARISAKGARLDLTRDEHGRLRHACIGFDPPAEDVRKAFERFVAALEKVPPGTFTHVEVDPALEAPTKAHRAQLDAAVARLTARG